MTYDIISTSKKREDGSYEATGHVYVFGCGDGGWDGSTFAVTGKRGGGYLWDLWQKFNLDTRCRWNIDNQWYWCDV